MVIHCNLWLRDLFFMYTCYTHFTLYSGNLPRLLLCNAVLCLSSFTVIVNEQFKSRAMGRLVHPSLYRIFIAPRSTFPLTFYFKCGILLSIHNDCLLNKDCLTTLFYKKSNLYRFFINLFRPYILKLKQPL